MVIAFWWLPSTRVLLFCEKLVPVWSVVFGCLSQPFLLWQHLDVLLLKFQYQHSALRNVKPALKWFSRVLKTCNLNWMCWIKMVQNKMMKLKRLLWLYFILGWGPCFLSCGLGCHRPRPFFVPFKAPCGMLRKGEASTGFSRGRWSVRAINASQNSDHNSDHCNHNHCKTNDKVHDSQFECLFRVCVHSLWIQASYSNLQRLCAIRLCRKH